jgi:hypothetical protein
MLEGSGEPSEELITFHVKLLRKLKKSVSMDKWEKVLTRYEYPYWYPYLYPYLYPYWYPTCTPTGSPTCSSAGTPCVIG